MATWAVFRYSVGSDKKERTIVNNDNLLDSGVTTSGRLCWPRPLQGPIGDENSVQSLSAFRVKLSAPQPWVSCASSARGGKSCLIRKHICQFTPVTGCVGCCPDIWRQCKQW